MYNNKKAKVKNMRKIQIIPKSEKHIAKEILYKYLTELSEFDDKIQFSDDGQPIYVWFENYWKDYGRFPFYFLCKNQIAGLAFIRETGDKQYEIAEFYVCPEFRKDGNAMWLACEVIELFDGVFDIGTQLKNNRAIAFWTKIANLYGVTKFVDDEKTRTWYVNSKNKKN